MKLTKKFVLIPTLLIIANGLSAAEESIQISGSLSMYFDANSASGSSYSAIITYDPDSGGAIQRLTEDPRGATDGSY